MPTSPDLLTLLVEKSVTVGMLAWFALRMESRIDSLAAAIREISARNIVQDLLAAKDKDTRK